MKSSDYLPALVAILTLTGCGLADFEAEWKDGPFEVEWIDAKSNSHLAYREEGSSISVNVVGECIVAAGANASYVAVKQLPSGSADIQYYVVSKARYAAQGPARSVTGPLSAQQYRALERQMRLPALRDILPLTECQS